MKGAVHKRCPHKIAPTMSALDKPPSPLTANILYGRPQSLFIQLQEFPNYWSCATRPRIGIPDYNKRRDLLLINKGTSFNH